MTFYFYLSEQAKRSIKCHPIYAFSKQKLAGYFGSAFQNYPQNQTNSKFVRHFTQGHKSDAFLHAACMPQAPLLESMAPA